MPLSAGQWQKALTADHLASVYLLAGEELLVLEAADALRAHAKKLGYPEREVLEVGQHFDWDDLARAAAGMSLFSGCSSTCDCPPAGQAPRVQRRSTRFARTRRPM